MNVQFDMNITKLRLFCILYQHERTKLVFGSLSLFESTFKINKMSGVNKTSHYLLKGGQKYENQGQSLTMYMCIKWSYILIENTLCKVCLE